jgi:hypothetical protein
VAIALFNGDVSGTGAQEWTKGMSESSTTDQGKQPNPADAPISGKAWLTFSAVAGALIAAGFLVGWLSLGAARFSQSCPRNAPSAHASWSGIEISGLPSSLAASFGYGRGTQMIETTLTATVPQGRTLPATIGVYVEPLTSADGTQLIPYKINADSRTLQRGIDAAATRVGNTSIYQLEVCIVAKSAVADSYTSQLLFPGAKLTAGTSLPLTVTFQSETVPFIVTVGLLPLSLLGIVYTTLILLRRQNTDLDIKQMPRNLWHALASINGILAGIVSIGAVFAAWNVQCYRNPVWGSPWPAILVSLVTMTGAAATASSVPMGLATGKFDKTADQRGEPPAT